MDSRKISEEQRKYIYATLNEISGYIGEELTYIKERMKHLFCGTYEREDFSLSNCEKSTATEFLEFLISFCIENGIEMAQAPSSRSSDITRQVYACLLVKRCICCGLPAEIHHVDAVGMGRDRETINHIGMKALSLCRTHHTEMHNVGDMEFIKKHHIEPVVIDKKIAEVYNLNKENQ